MLGYCFGDNAATAMIELVGYNENMLGEKSEKKAKTRRSRSKKSAESSSDSSAAE